VLFPEGDDSETYGAVVTVTVTVSALSVTGASVRTDGGSYLKTSWYTISDAPHPITVTWQAATGAGATDGSLTFRVNGTVKETLSALDNDSLRVEQARLGPLQGIDSRTRGTEFFDEFVSRR